MSAINTDSTSTTGCATGAWRLSPRQAMSLRPTRAGRLRVTCGGVWATFDGPHRGPGNARGDHVLAPGDVVEVGPGERLVVEPAGAGQGAFLEWEAAAGGGQDSGRVLRRRDTADVPARPTLVLRLVFAALAVALTGGLWLGAAAESARHRADIDLLAGKGGRPPAAAAPAAMRTAAGGGRPPA